MHQGLPGINDANITPFPELTKENKEKFMEYKEFERIMSKKRMNRYLESCGGDTRKAMTLYRYNLHLTQDVFTVISCFEVALRNAIDARLVPILGEEWLKESIMPGGIFSGNDFRETRKIIERAYHKLVNNGTYSHSKLLAEMEFGVWKYMFSAKQYRATGRSLLKIFPNKTRSTPEMQYNQSYVFNELDKVNTLRNRLAHHEPICFYLNEPEIDTGYIVTEYQKIQSLFAWMDIDSRAMLYGLDHVLATCSKINALKP